METVPRITATFEALDLIDELIAQHGPLMFHQSGGCCDGSQPMCFSKGEFRVGYSDVCLGLIAGIEFWMSKDQFEYWKHTQLILDVIEGSGGTFSLEGNTGKAFHTRSRLFTEAEWAEIEPQVLRDLA